MDEQLYQFSAFNRFIHWVGSSRWGARIFSRLLPRLDRTYYRLSGQQQTLTSILSGLPVILLGTTGAKTGRSHMTPLLYLYDPADHQQLGIVASNWGGKHNPGWYYNLKASGTATGLINGQRHHYQAHEADPAEYARIWTQAAALYPGFALYKQRAAHRHIPIMILRPMER
jgi:deazaflavin-dependent oxidoreductase (nitroreductase family)